MTKRRVASAALLSVLFGCSGGSGGGDGGPLGEHGPPAPGTRCSLAESVTLTGGTLTVSGSTAGATDEYDGAVNCRSTQTTMVGPQRYYKLRLEQDVVYKVSLDAQFSGARVYFFTECGASAINSACGSGGSKGAISPSLFGGRAFFFLPPTGGDWIVAVDSTSQQSSGGDFTLTITSATAPAERRCADAKVLTLDASGKATVKGDTEAAINEFLRIGCGSSTIFDGPQVYYRVALKQGKVYQIQLSEAFSGARFYLFEGASCTAESIETSCSSEGKTGLVSDTGGSNGAARLFRPAADGDYTIAVDSGSETAFGAFQLSIEEVTPPANATCDSAEAVALTAGAATIKATTFAGLDEYGAQVSCGGATPLDGPQVYYRPAFETGKTYELTVSSSFTGRIYGFGSNCDATQIEVDCSSHGATGFSATTSSQAKKVYFTASGSGPWTVALDSSSESQSGEFELSIAEFPVAANGSCAAAQQVTLSSGQATQLDGDTTAVLNEFGTTINCGGGSTSVLDGPQVYYQVSLVGGTTYQLTITPTFFGARLYLAQAGCDTVTINADCASKGQTGLVSNSLQSNKATTVEFTPQSSGDYLVVVDSAIDTSFGRFSLTIAEKAP